MVMATEIQKETDPIPSVKDLASSDPSLRRKNLQQILSHLETRPSSHYLSHTQALQLWRGFHVALYMHDSKNQLSVQTLIATLSSTFKLIRKKDRELTNSIATTSQAPVASSTNGSIRQSDSNSKKTSGRSEGEDEFTGFADNTSFLHPQFEITDSPSWLSTYSKAFWETMAREWSGVDQWRMNKFLSLIRFALREILEITLLAYFGAEAEMENHITETNSKGGEAPEDAAQEPATTTDNKKSKKRKGASNGNDPPLAASVSQTTKKAKTSPSSSSSSSSSSSTSKQPPSPASLTSQPDPSTALAQLHLLASNPLAPRDRKPTNDGLRLHMLDIYNDELFRAVDSLLAAARQEPQRKIQKDELKRVLEEQFMRPVKEVSVDGLSRNVRVKAKEVLEEFGERVAEI